MLKPRLLSIRMDGAPTGAERSRSSVQQRERALDHINPGTSDESE